MLVLLIGIERRPVVPSVLYGVGVVLMTYTIFVYVLKTPLPLSSFGI
jgi:hypothetical protein